MRQPALPPPRKCTVDLLKEIDDAVKAAQLRHSSLKCQIFQDIPLVADGISAEYAKRFGGPVLPCTLFPSHPMVAV